jgi:hypothetical protein
VILPFFVAEWRRSHPDAWEAFEEKAGQIQHDGAGCSREESERRAEPLIRSTWARVRTGASTTPRARADSR